MNKNIFGKIDFLNLLPLHIYLKKYPLPSGLKKASEYKKGVPSKLNRDLFHSRVGAAVISSIESRHKRYKSLDIGICANKKVKSVIVQKHTPYEKDAASATSNALAQILGTKGRVIIGDRALRAFLQDESGYIDLCEAWYERYRLPFVFARFCYTGRGEFFKKIFTPFLRRKIFIPRYILDSYAQSRRINSKDIKTYLQLIYYKISFKEKKALKLFLNKTKTKELR